MAGLDPSGGLSENLSRPLSWLLEALSSSVVSLGLWMPHSDAYLYIHTAFCLCVSVLPSCEDTSLWTKVSPYSRSTSH